MALFPLLILYLGYMVIDNMTKTIARNGSYIKVFLEKEGTGLHWENRLAQQRRIIDSEEKAPSTDVRSSEEQPPVMRMLSRYWPRPHLPVYEEWMASLAQRAFIWAGWFCIAVYAWISLVILLSPNPSNDVLTPNRVLNLVAGLLVFAGALAWWVYVWYNTRQQVQLLHGSNSLMDQMVDYWEKVYQIEEQQA